MISVSVVIPSYNGRKLLEKNLPPLMSACGRCDSPVEVIVVDDASSDDTVTFIKNRYPSVRLVQQSVNVGFARAMNSGVSVANGSIILALNNDIAVGDNLFAEPLHRFRDPTVFSVTPNVVYPHNARSQSITRLKPGFCWFRALELQLPDIQGLDGEVPIFFGSGGASFYDKEKFRALGGFDAIYHPFYVEDIDLSYRAWKAGWKCLLEPLVTVCHENNSTIRNFYRKRWVKTVSDRNRILFMWLNITDRYLIFRYFVFLPLSFLYDILTLRKYKFVGFFLALKFLPILPELRRKRCGLFRISDRQVFARIR